MSAGFRERTDFVTCPGCSKTSRVLPKQKPSVALIHDDPLLSHPDRLDSYGTFAPCDPFIGFDAEGKPLHLDRYGRATDAPRSQLETPGSRAGPCLDAQSGRAAVASWHRLCRLVLTQLNRDGKRRVRNRGYSGCYNGVYMRGIIMEKSCIKLRKSAPRYLERWNLRAFEWRHLSAIRCFLRIWMEKTYADLEAIIVVIDAEGMPQRGEPSRCDPKARAARPPTGKLRFYPEHKSAAVRVRAHGIDVYTRVPQVPSTSVHYSRRGASALSATKSHLESLGLRAMHGAEPVLVSVVRGRDVTRFGQTKSPLKFIYVMYALDVETQGGELRGNSAGFAGPTSMPHRIDESHMRHTSRMLQPPGGWPMTYDDHVRSDELAQRPTRHPQSATQLRYRCQRGGLPWRLNCSANFVKKIFYFFIWRANWYWSFF